MTTTPDKNEIRERLLKFFPPKNCFVFIFGSRANHTARPTSDWDIGVISNREIRGAVMEKAREELEEIRTLHSFDLVNFANTSEDFRKIAMRKIEPLIGRNNFC